MTRDAPTALIIAVINKRMLYKICYKRNNCTCETNQTENLIVRTIFYELLSF